MIVRRTILAFTVAMLSLLASTGLASDGDPFTQGSRRVTVLVGSGTAFDESYFIIGAGLGYYIADNVEIGVDAESWSGGTYDIVRVSPSVRMVLPTGTATRPYAGVFYQRTFISDLPDRSAVGGRAGVFWLSGPRSYFGAGVVHTRFLNCDASIYRPCSDTYPEIVIAFRF